jgi:dephospho-CoA kinase
MIIVGITGGIGSGKSVVSRIFRQLGIPVYDADAAARSLYERHPEVLQKLQSEFGETLVDAKGRLDRKKLASIVFQNEDKLKLLNRLVHPLVKKDFKEWASLHRAAPYVMKEAAILFESGTHKDCDLVITVTAPTELRVQRVKSRDQRPTAEIRQVMSQQWSDEEKIKRSQFVIQNDEDDAVLPQALDIHEKILQLSRERIQSSHNTVKS